MSGPPNTTKTVSRRRFLKVGVAGSAALALGGALAWQTRGYEVPAAVSSRLRALSPKEYLIAKAVAARVLRRDADDLPMPEELHVAEYIDGMVARLDEANRTDLKRLLHVLEHVLPWSAAKPSRFTRLDGAGKDAVLASMMSSSVGLLRGAFEALKSLCVMAYFRDARTWGAIGYDGPLLNRPVEGWARLRVRERR
ncbi:MAG: gluconate 2-dehydrogenase subunit 3 family protein [Sandaracinaceae bacterium]|nr:gluconate 2-dehydrogenase subunit 3 family protein [Sandaracinaceae bacterium]